jgi:FLVCR family MFS transporter 7
VLSSGLSLKDNVLIDLLAADTFQISLTRVNWLSSVIGIIYLPIALLMPSATSRYGLRQSVSLQVAIMACYTESLFISVRSAPSSCCFLRGFAMLALLNHYPTTVPMHCCSLAKCDCLTLTSGQTCSDIHIQIFAGVAPPIFQILGPVYSELWFDTGGRQSATTILTVSNLIGGS